MIHDLYFVLSDSSVTAPKEINEAKEKIKYNKNDTPAHPFPTAYGLTAPEGPGSRGKRVCSPALCISTPLFLIAGIIIFNPLPTY